MWRVFREFAKPELETGLGEGDPLEARLGGVIEAVEARTVNHDRKVGR